jgi:hypothetical protein
MVKTGKEVYKMNKAEVKKDLNESLQRFIEEVESWMTSKPTSFSPAQKEEIKFLMKQVFYTLSDFQEVIEKITD